jgi:hypothetical protein
MFAVNADTQNLGIYPLEPVESDLVGGDLRRSYGGPGHREEGQDNIFAPKKITQANFCPTVIFQAEVGGILSNA